MANFVLRKMPDSLWKRFAARAKADGWTLKDLLLKFMADYAEGRVAYDIQSDALRKETPRPI